MLRKPWVALSRSSINQEILGKGLCLLAAVGFSSVSILGKLGFAGGLENLNMLAARFGGASLVALVAVFLIKGKDAFPSGHQMASLMLLGAVGYVGQTWLFFSGLDKLPASMNVLIYRMYPLFVALIDWKVNKRSLRRNYWIAMLVAFIGVFLMIGPQELIGTDQATTLRRSYLLYPLGAAIVNAVYLVLAERPIAEVGAYRGTTWILAGTAISTFLLGLISGSLNINAILINMPIIIGLILVSTILPVFSLLTGLSIVGPTIATLLTTAEPLITVLLAYIFLGERLTIVQGVGGILLILAIIILTITREPELVKTRSINSQISS